MRTRARGGIGIRVRLRSVWGNPWEFKSPRAHNTTKAGPLPAFVVFDISIDLLSFLRYVAVSKEAPVQGRFRDEGLMYHHMDKLHAIFAAASLAIKRDMRVRWGAAAGASVLLSAGVFGMGGSIVPNLLVASTTPRSVIPQERIQPRTLEVVDMSTSTVFEIVSQLPRAERFEMMLYNSGADDVLKERGTYTVFVPESSRFDYLPRNYIASLTRSDARELALSHMVARDISMTESLNGGIITLGQTLVSYEVDTEANTISVDDAKVIKAYRASNGWVYLIDRVLANTGN